MGLVIVSAGDVAFPAVPERLVEWFPECRCVSYLLDKTH